MEKATIRIIIIISLILAVFISFYDYLLFHIAIEAFGIIIITSMLLIAFNTYHLSNNHYFMFLAISFGFIGLFAFVHTLTYRGMPVFSEFTANIPTQLYIITKYMNSISLVLSFRYLQQKLSVIKVIISFSLVSAALFLSVFYWGNFPECFIEGKGLTLFKITSEYIITVILLIAIGLLIKNKSSFNPKVYRDMVYSIVASILAGLSFTFYINVYGLSNMLGHLLQLFSFYFIFRGIIKTSLNNPFEFLYFNLSQANKELQKMNEQLVDYNTEIEAQQEELEKAYKKVHEGIEKARKIHENFLPKSLPEVKGISFAYYYKPAYDLGGDFFSVQEMADKLLIYIVDVSGHGLDGAILNIFIRENINKYLLTCQYENKEVLPSEVLNFLITQYAKEDFPDEYYICMQIGVLDSRTNKFTFSNAGMHISPFVVKNKGELTRLDAPGFPILSAFDFLELPYYDHTVNLTSEFTILMTTDGLVEEMQDGIMYGEERLTKVLLDNHQNSAKYIVQAINNDFHSFSENKHSRDDITYLVVKGS